ncbi:ubiquitin-protein ligase 1, partial [Tribonema minus]
GDGGLSPAARRRAVAAVERRCLTRHARCLEDLYAGVAAVVPAELLALFTAEEAEELFCGVPEVDVELLERVTEYEGVQPTDPHIQHFWTALRGMDARDRGALVLFCSGRARLPPSAADFPMNFTLTAPHPATHERPDDYLPLAQTCFFSLALPRYSSLETCRAKLLYAIRNANLMDADYVMRSADGWENLT